jgi:tetratricopeptide (TPR) repeat protein
MKPTISVSACCLVLLTMSGLRAQTTADPFQKGLALEREFKVEAALSLYEEALKKKPDHYEALQHASRMLSNIAGKLPKNQLTRKRELLKQAQSYAQKSIKLNPNVPESHLAHIVSIGLLSEIATNPREKVADAWLIYGEAVRILEIDTTYAEAYFVLGKWQHELSKLNWMELMACKIFFGGFPESISIEAAIRYYNKALQFNPNSILFLYGKGSALYQIGENEQAASVLNRALALPEAEPDDILRKERCSTLLRQIIQ